MNASVAPLETSNERFFPDGESQVWKIYDVSGLRTQVLHHSPCSAPVSFIGGDIVA